jgi:HemY protein
MINLLLLLVFLSCLGIVGAWIAGNPGSVTIHWFDYQVDTSFAFLLLIALAAGFSIACAWALLRRIVLAPARYKQSRQLAHYQKGLTELTYSVAALASADIAGAQTHTRKAEKLLGRTPLTLLLSAQIARSQGNDGETRILLEHMLEHKETEYLAARSLSESASKKQLFPKAIALAERAQALNPNAVDTVVSLYIRQRQWPEALAALRVAGKKGHGSRSELRRYRGLIYVQQANYLLQQGRNDMALPIARQAVKELPGFVPAIATLAKALAANDQQPKATKLLLASWKLSPHPQLADIFRHIISNQPHEKRARLLNALNALHPEATIPGSVWVCKTCHHTTALWDTHCLQCSAFDTLEWRDTVQ